MIPPMDILAWRNFQEGQIVRDSTRSKPRQVLTEKREGTRRYAGSDNLRINEQSLHMLYYPLRRFPIP